MADTAHIPLGPVQEVNQDTIDVFEGVKHDILHKIWELHKEDDLHHLNEVRKLEHVKFYRPIAYREQKVPYGVNYFGKIVLDDAGHCVHARIFRPAEGQGAIVFHAIHNRVREEGGALFTKEDEITYFEY